MADVPEKANTQPKRKRRRRGGPEPLKTTDHIKYALAGIVCVALIFGSIYWRTHRQQTEAREKAMAKAAAMRPPQQPRPPKLGTPSDEELDYLPEALPAGEPLPKVSDEFVGDVSGVAAVKARLEKGREYFRRGGRLESKEVVDVFKRLGKEAAPLLLQFIAEAATDKELAWWATTAVELDAKEADKALAERLTRKPALDSAPFHSVGVALGKLNTEYGRAVLTALRQAAPADQKYVYWRMLGPSMRETDIGEAVAALDGNAPTRSTAVNALCELGTFNFALAPLIVAQLEARLSNQDAKKRRMAAMVLEQLPFAAVETHLAVLLRDADADVRLSAYRGLVREDNGLEMLLPLLREETNLHAYCHVLRALKGNASDAAVDVLLRAIDHPDNEVRIAAHESLIVLSDGRNLGWNSAAWDYYFRMLKPKEEADFERLGHNPNQPKKKLETAEEETP